MDIRKWKEASLPPSEWVTKLTEELGEVADIVATDPELKIEAHRQHLMVELDQVIFIAQQFQERIGQNETLA